LLTATTPPTGRFVLVNGLNAWVETSAGQFALSSQVYTPGVVSPDGERRIEAFASEPWPCWTFRLEDGTRIEHELFVPHGTSAVALCWRLLDTTRPAQLFVRLFLSGRDYHALQHENSAFQFAPDIGTQRLTWHPYHGVPGTIARHDGAYDQQ